MGRVTDLISRSVAGAALLTGSTILSPALAAPDPVDLGKVGPTYGVAEPDMLEWIEGKLRAAQESGKLEKLQNEAAERAKASVENPDPLGVPTIDYDSTVSFDPSVVAKRDIKDHRGRVIVAAGTRVNPLDHMAFQKEMLLFDARDPRQVEWAERHMAKARAEGREPKPILVGGSYMDLMRKWKEPVYFDQTGTIVKRLNIGAVPVRVWRKPGDRVLTMRYFAMRGGSGE